MMLVLIMYKRTSVYARPLCCYSYDDDRGRSWDAPYMCYLVVILRNAVTASVGRECDHSLEATNPQRAW